MLRLNVDGADLAAVLSSREIRAGTIMRVIETQAGGTRCKDKPAVPMCWNIGCTLFGRPIDTGRYHLAVPVQLLRSVGIVEYVYSDLLTFFEPQ